MTLLTQITQPHFSTKNTMTDIALMMKRQHILNNYHISFSNELGECVCQALYKNSVLGVAKVTSHTDIAHIHSISIHPFFRQAGIGRKMIERIVNEFSGAFTTAIAGRATDNVSVSFFRACGFDIQNSGAIKRQLSYDKVEHAKTFLNKRFYDAVRTKRFTLENTIATLPDEQKAQLMSETVNWWLYQNSDVDIHIINIESVDNTAPEWLLANNNNPFFGVRVWYRVNNLI
ncbi:TPA: GNAT family N-acetyltransferase [Providencia rettgeri]